MKTIRGLIILVAVLYGPLAAQAEDVTLNYQGLVLNGKLTMAQGKTLGDGVILLVHGTLAHNGMEIIREAQRALAERDISSLAITLSLGIDRRTGTYDCNTPHRHKHTDAPGEIGAWLKWLREKGANHIVLAGHSRGGNQVAWLAADGMPATVKALVLIAPPTYEAGKNRKQYESVDPGGYDGALARAKNTGPNRLLSFPVLLYCRDVRATAASFLSYYTPNPRFDTPSLVQKTQLPVLVIAGSRDEVSPNLAERVKPLVSERVRLVVVQDAGHFFRDLYLEDAADAMAEFMEGLK